MTLKVLSRLSKGLTTPIKHNKNLKDSSLQCLASRSSRSMATVASTHLNQTPESAVKPEFLNASVLTTIYRFPTMEPLRFESYSSRHLHLPLRRDILHRAIVYEGDGTRQGTASTKTRFDVHGSHRKIRPQKGTGRSRLGTRQSPALVGGGVVFGPHPRDFATRLPRKMYDLAWRTALSWRYRRGELIVCENDLDLEYPDPYFAQHIFEHNHWGKPHGRSLLVVDGKPENLFQAMEKSGKDGRALHVSDVDVKDLLELGRVIVEKRALDKILSQHESDLVPKVKRVV
ncbi:hypothetical protein K3495_g411 [Podosphaera aphanis]|nr:hypothetical protein K3495_g411 [Podosphaera aphanis]